MSRIMLLGVLRMPEELVVSVMGHKLMAVQHVSRYHEAADVIEEQDRRIAELERELESVKQYAQNYLYPLLDSFISVYSDTDFTLLTYKGWINAGKPNGTITPATAPEGGEIVHE